MGTAERLASAVSNMWLFDSAVVAECTVVAKCTRACTGAAAGTIAQLSFKQRSSVSADKRLLKQHRARMLVKLYLLPNIDGQ